MKNNFPEQRTSLPQERGWRRRLTKFAILGCKSRDSEVQDSIPHLEPTHVVTYNLLKIRVVLWRVGREIMWPRGKRNGTISCPPAYLAVVCDCWRCAGGGAGVCLGQCGGAASQKYGAF